MTAAIDTDRCRVCGAEEAGDVLDGLLRRCGACTFTWTATELAPPEVLYAGDYFAGGGYDDYYEPRARRFESRRRLRWLLSTGPVASLLEAGAAAGFFVEVAAAAGIDAQGVEISPAAAGYARDTLGVAVHQGAFESTVLPQRFDVVCAFHVLEHVVDPAELLRVARRMLLPGGRIALEVPNIASAASARLGASWPHIDPRHHLWHFTPTSLRRLVVDAGFEVVRQDTVFSRFYWRPVARQRHARELLIADWAASRSPRVTHPSLGDASRIVARRTDAEVKG